MVVVHPHKGVASIPPHEPNDVQAYYNRGNVRDELGDKQGAIADYNHGLNINPNFPQAYKGRGLTRSELRDNHGAINDLSRGFETR